MTQAKKRPRGVVLTPTPDRENQFDELLIKKELGSIRMAKIVRMVPDKGYGFLRGESDQADTFFHVHVVRFTAAEMKKRKKADVAEAFAALEIGSRVLYLPSGLSKDGKGARARWVGVGDPGELV